MPLLCAENSIVPGDTMAWPSQLSSRCHVIFVRYLIPFLPSVNVDTFLAQQASLIIHNRIRTCFFGFLFFSIIFFSFQGNTFPPYAILIQQLRCRPISHGTLCFDKTCSRTRLIQRNVSLRDQLLQRMWLRQARPRGRSRAVPYCAGIRESLS